MVFAVSPASKLDRGKLTVIFVKGLVKPHFDTFSCFRDFGENLGISKRCRDFLFVNIFAKDKYIFMRYPVQKVPVESFYIFKNIHTKKVFFEILQML